MATDFTQTESEDEEVESAEAEGGHAAFSSGQSTKSVTESVYQFVFENDRRYSCYGPEGYPLPNDLVEQDRYVDIGQTLLEGSESNEYDRLDLRHYHVRMSYDGQLYKAPIDNPTTILDCGTGTGVWCVDMAEIYPDAHIIGSDISPIQPGW